jgi:hypothetical protein
MLLARGKKQMQKSVLFKVQLFPFDGSILFNSPRKNRQNQTDL